MHSYARGGFFYILKFLLGLLRVWIKISADTGMYQPICIGGNQTNTALRYVFVIVLENIALYRLKISVVTAQM